LEFADFDIRCELGDGLETDSADETVVGGGQMDSSRAAVGRPSLKPSTTIIIYSNLPDTLPNL
jgi:hypothetical protein